MIMKSSDWQFFLSGRHRRMSRLWQSFFAGWGLFFTMVLIASPFVFRNITWSLLDAVDTESLKQNNLSVTNVKLSGVAKDGEPFSVSAKSAFQRFSEPDVIRFTEPIADVARNSGGKKIRDKISAANGRMLKNEHKIVLSGDVLVESSDGSSVRTRELEIDLK
jgi:hypothetical protein